MAWTSWSRTWTIRTKATTSRKRRKCSPNNLRWKRMYLLLRADQRLKQNHKDVFLPAHPQKLYLLVKELGLIEQEEYSLPDYSVSKKLINLLRHGCLPREDDGAIEFWRSVSSERSCAISSLVWWCMEEYNGKRRRQQAKYLNIVLTRPDKNSLPPSLQNNVLIPNNFLEYVHHIGCAINLHSIINSGLIPGGQHLSNRKTVFFLLVDPMDKEHKDPEKIDLGAPRRAQYMH